MKTLLFIGSLFCLSVINAQKHYVRQDATGTGTSWDDASGDLQAMINKAVEGDSIFVSAGIYKPERPADKVILGSTNQDSPDNAFVLKKGVKLFGGFAAKGQPVFADRNFKDNETILSGDLGKEDDNSDNVYHVVISVSDDKNTALDGFTISDGMARAATPYRTITVEGKEIATNSGGGLCNISSSPAINNVTFSKNGAESWGGGIYNVSSSSPAISKSTFTENFAFNGGAMFNNISSSPDISHSTFTKNNASNSGGAIDNEISSSPKITYCTFSVNFASKMGAAINNYSHSSPQITNSLIVNNSSYGMLNTAVASGAAVFNNYACMPVITNTTFWGNKVTFTDAYGSSGAGVGYNNLDYTGYDTLWSGGKLTNCIFWDSIGPNPYNSKGFQEIYVSRKQGPLTVSNCVIQNYGSANYTQNYTATSFVLADPMFTDPGKSDFTLQAGSSAIDVGLNTAYPGGVDALDTALDLAGSKRLIAGIVDMGAYEYQGVTSLSPFATKAVGDSVLMRWNTSAKARSFSIQRSDDGTHFTSIGTITAGTGTRYTYTDKKPSLVHTNYYRIKQIDNNTDSSFSAVRTITFRYVKTDGTAAGNGLTWATASNDLQAVLNKAIAGDEVRVAAGTYKPNRRADALETVTANDRDNAFVLKDSVNLYGGFPAKGTPAFSERKWKTTPSILSGNIGGADSTDNAYHVVISVADTITTLIDGFTISGGNANGNNGITVKSVKLYQGYGGGMDIFNSSPAIMHCTFTGNTSPYQGGGMIIYHADGFVSAPVLSNCKFTGNNSNTGGGLYIEDGTPTITNTLFSKNYGNNGAALANNSQARPELTNVTIAGNMGNYGAALYNSYSFPIIKNTIIYGNGSGISALGGKIVYQNSLVQDVNSDTAGNIPGNVNPLFTDAAKGDYTLQYFSPAVNKGSNSIYPGGATALKIARDLADSARLIGISVDMGAYEFAKVVDPKKDSVGNLKLKLGVTKDTVFISWSAITSDTNAVFNVQRSTDGVHFTTIKTVNSNKKTGTPVVYSTFDDEPANGVNYYRIQALRSVKDPIFSEIEEITATVRQPVIRYVKPGATGDGSSWQKASGDIQAMINAADRNDQVWVAAGTYKPNRRAEDPTVITPNHRHNAFLLKSHVRLYGGFAGNETDTSQRNWTKNVTILSGDFNGDDGISGSTETRNLKLTNNTENASNLIISVHDDAKTILDGFTVTGGNADFVRTDENPSSRITVEGELITYYYFGSGMYNYASSPTIRNVTFLRNESQNQGAGAMYNELSSPFLYNCSFIENNTYGNGGSSTFGGAIYNYVSSPVIINTTFKNNMSWYVGGAIASIADYYLYSDYVPVLTIINCTFSGNTAGNGFGVDESNSGAVFNSSSVANITNSLFYNNQASVAGAIGAGGSDYYGYSGYLNVYNCTFYGNKSKTNDRVGPPIGGGAIVNGNGKLSFLTIKNTIIYGNSAVYGDSGLYNGALSPFVNENNLIQGRSAGGSGNIDGSINPLFKDPANNDFSLQAASPVINKGSNAGYPGGPQALVAAVDLASNPRLRGSSVDMGAFEYQSGPLPVTMFIFTAIADKQTALLQWKTATEINNSHFDVERSTDGINFIKIGAVEGHGTTTMAQQYSFTDVAPVKGNDYYRITQVDVNGHKQYSSIRMLVFGDEANKQLYVYPNPAINVLHVKLPGIAATGSELQLFDATGHEVLRKQVPASAGNVDVEISNIAAGVYIVRYGNQSVKIIKQ